MSEDRLPSVISSLPLPMNEPTARMLRAEAPPRDDGVTPALAVEGLTVRAGAAALRIDGVSFDVGAGEIVAIIGPNGAGKTTLLEAIAGLTSSEGVVRVRGRPLRTFRDRARAFSYAPDQGRLPTEATVRTLLDDALARGRRAGARSAALEALGVDALFDRSCGALSRGEAQRVTLSLALAADRPIVLLDEPFGAFDPLQLARVLDAVRATAAAGRAVIATLHQLADAEKIAHRVLLLAGGKVVAFDTLASLRAALGEPEASLERVFVALLERAPDAP
jgi:ABC-type multidrug transport system ATPase subunit